MTINQETMSALYQAAWDAYEDESLDETHGLIERSVDAALVALAAAGLVIVDRQDLSWLTDQVERHDHVDTDAPTFRRVANAAKAQ